MKKLTRAEIVDEIARLEAKGDPIGTYERIQTLKKAKKSIDIERAAEEKRLHPR